MIPFPTILRAPSEFMFDLSPNAYGGSSGESLSGQIIQELGIPWLCSMTWQQFNPIQSDIMRAWLAQMHGMAGLTRLGDIRRPRPRYVTGVPLVNGANQTGTVLNLKSVTTGQTFVQGDYLGIGNNLHMVTVGGAADGAGLVSIQIEPPILVPYGDNAVVTLDSPTALFRLRSNVNALVSDSRIGGWSRGITLDFIEVLP